MKICICNKSESSDKYVLKPNLPVIKIVLSGFIIYMGYWAWTDEHLTGGFRIRGVILVILILALASWANMLQHLIRNGHSYACSIYGSVARTFVKIANA